MGETQNVDKALQEDQEMEYCVRRARRNGMWNIFEGVEAAMVQKVAGLPLEMVQQLISDPAHHTTSECLSCLSDIWSESCQSSSSTSASSDRQCDCGRARIQRSFSATAGEEMRAALRNRRRRNAVGNLFDLLTPSQKLLLVEHLQEQKERLHTFHPDVSADNGYIILSLADLSSTSSTSSSSSSVVSSPRSQGEIVCR